jgi:hypothetical protein
VEGAPKCADSSWSLWQGLKGNNFCCQVGQVGVYQSTGTIAGSCVASGQAGAATTARLVRDLTPLVARTILIKFNQVSTGSGATATSTSTTTARTTATTTSTTKGIVYFLVFGPLQLRLNAKLRTWNSNDYYYICYSHCRTAQQQGCFCTLHGIFHSDIPLNTI